MSRRLTLFLALLASFVLTACAAVPQAPAITDPKEILVRSVTSLQSVKTMSIRGVFSGSMVAEGMGNIDLSSVTLQFAADMPGKKARLQLDAPSIAGTNIDLIVVEDAVYMKVLGLLGAFIGGDASGKYMKIPAGTGAVPEEATNPLEAIAELRTAIDELPNPPTKLADERCGDTDCYHVQIAVDAADLGTLPVEGAALGGATFDIWSRKNDLRPAKLGLSVDAGDQGRVNATFEISYDGSVDISAPPADQVTEGMPLGG
jgi:hypothetical protein